VKGFLRSLGDLSLRAKVTLTLVTVFLFSATALLAVLVPVLGEQRQRLLDQDKRLSTLRRNYERDFIYDLLSCNRESWRCTSPSSPARRDPVGAARVQRPRPRLDRGRGGHLRLLGEDAAPLLGKPGVVLLVDCDGEADLVGPGGRPLLAAA
jgi:hypothetical protein